LEREHPEASTMIKEIQLALPITIKISKRYPQKKKRSANGFTLIKQQAKIRQVTKHDYSSSKTKQDYWY
jgi:hypothetical protein